MDKKIKTQKTTAHLKKEGSLFVVRTYQMTHS